MHSFDNEHIVFLHRVTLESSIIKTRVYRWWAKIFRLWYQVRYTSF